MQRKKGFTLIELMITIGILAVVGLAVGISINKVSENAKNSEWERIVNRVKSAADTYASKNTDIIKAVYNETGHAVIFLSELIESGLIEEENLVDPRDNINIKDKGEGYQQARIYLNEDAVLEIAYPFTVGNYLKLDPPRVLNAVPGQIYNYMVGVTANDKNNNPAADFDESMITKITSSGTLDKTNNTVVFSEAGDQYVTYLYEGVKYTRIYEIIPLETTINTPGEHTIEIKTTGVYEFMLAGAQGQNGASGGEIKGEIKLNKGDIIVVRVGAQTGSYAGGAGKDQGGGATLVKLNNEILLGAAGGGGGAAGTYGGNSTGSGGICGTNYDETITCTNGSNGDAFGTAASISGGGSSGIFKSCTKLKQEWNPCVTGSNTCVAGYEDKNCNSCYYGHPSTCSYGCDSVWNPNINCSNPRTTSCSQCGYYCSSGTLSGKNCTICTKYSQTGGSCPSECTSCNCTQ